MVSSCEIEDLVMQGTDILRKERRKRPTTKDLYFYVQEFDEENILDFDNFHELIQNMIKKKLIYNSHGSDETKESFYVHKENTTCRSSIIKKNSLVESIKQQSTPACANPLTPTNKSPKIGLNKIDELINKRVIEIVEPYISKFTLFIDEYEKLVKEKEATETKNRELPEEKYKQSSVIAIENMQKEINFLKDELKRKDEIIKVMTDEQKLHETVQPHTKTIHPTIRTPMSVKKN